MALTMAVARRAAVSARSCGIWSQPSTSIARAMASAAQPLPKDKPRVLVIGSGYAGFSCAKNLDPNLFDVTIVS